MDKIDSRALSSRDLRHISRGDHSRVDEMAALHFVKVTEEVINAIEEIQFRRAQNPAGFVEHFSKVR